MIARLFLVFLSTVVLGACAHNTPAPPAQVQYIFVKPSAELLKDCSKSAPPDRKRFMAATPDERLKMLAAADISHQNDTDKCNERWKTLREWYAQREALYEKEPNQ